MKNLIRLTLVLFSISLQAQNECNVQINDFDCTVCEGQTHAMDDQTFRIFAHSIDHNMNSGPSFSEIAQNIEDMQNFYADYGIYFAWDCSVNQINDTGNQFQPWLTFSDQTSEFGIDIFFYPDTPLGSSFASGLAAGAPSTAFYVAGEAQMEPGVLSRSSSVLYHEMGHCLGLVHTSQSAVPPDFPQNCIDEPDCCCDTNPTPGQLRSKTDFSDCTYLLNDGWDPAIDNIMSLTWTQCTIKFTDDQKARMKESIYCFPICAEALAKDDLITDTQTWDLTSHPTSEVFFAQNLIIDGGNLTIESDITVHFGEGYGIEIINGGEVLLNGKLTHNSCSNKWKGVKISGAASKLTTRNATITKANNAVTVSSDGVIDAIGTSFYNNKNSIKVNPDSGSNSIIDCEFLIDPYYSFLSFKNMISFNNNDANTEIKGGYFRNFDDGGGAAITSSNGTFSIVATYDHDKYGFSSTPNKVRFMDFNRGIEAYNGITNTYSVENAIFNECNIGILNNEVSSAKIIYSTFYIGDDQVGVMYEGPTIGIINQENAYKSFGAASNDVGIVVKGIGTMSNLIRRNTFRNLEYGNLANGENAVSDPFLVRGLNYQCNNNAGNIDYDFAVANNIDFSINNIRSQQGLLNQDVFDSAANIFNYTAAITGSDFFNEGGSPVNYNYDASAQGEEPQNFSGIQKSTSLENTCPINQYLNNPPIVITTIPPGPGTTILTNGIASDSLKDIWLSILTQNNDSTALEDYIIAQNDWDETLPYILNEVMTDNQAVASPITDYSLPLGTTLPTDSWNVISWIAGESFEADLLVTRIFAEENQYSAAVNYLSNMAAYWNMSPYQNATVQDYAIVYNLINSTDLDSLDKIQQQDLNDLIINNAINTSAQSWVKSILSRYDYSYGVTFTKIGSTTIRSGSKRIDSIIHPNPTTGLIQLSVSQNGSLTLYDIAGTKLKKMKVSEGMNNIDISNLKSGVIIYYLTLGSEIQTGKLIKL